MNKFFFFYFLFFCTGIAFGQQEIRAKIMVDTVVYETDSQQIRDSKLYFQEAKKLSHDQCKKDSLRATEEAKYNLSYSLPLPTPAMNEDLFLAENEFRQVLRKNKIGYGGYILGNCFGLKDNCFQWEMNRIVENKFGKQFLENLKIEATKMFILNNPDRVFEYEECDMESRYASGKTYEEMFTLVKNDYFQNFSYPEDFVAKSSNNKSSYGEADFILDKKGKVSKLTVTLSLKEKKNYIYSAYLIESLKDFILKSKWKSANYNGVPVLSKMNVLIFYK